MSNATRAHSPAEGNGRQATRSSVRRISRFARAASLAVPIAAVSVSASSTAALAVGSQPHQVATVTSVAWHKLTLINGWKSSQSAWTSGDPSYAISGGMVYLSGSLHGGAAGSNFAILPKAARPAHWMYLTVYNFLGSHGTLVIKPDGEMKVYSTPSDNATNFVSLASVSYPAAGTTLHKLTLNNGWTSAQTPYGTGAPAYVIKNGIIHLAGSLKGGTSDGFSFLPPTALQPHIVYRGIYTLGGAFGGIYISKTGYMGGLYSGNSKVFASLAGISLPLKTITQHKLTLLNGWKSAETPYGAGTFSYAVKDGIVYLSGGVKQPSGTSNVVAVLPKAARPAHVLYITVFTSSVTPGTLVIRPDGTVSVSSPTDPSAARTLTSLAAISYPHNS
jgi:hypothetical protein